MDTVAISGGHLFFEALPFEVRTASLWERPAVFFSCQGDAVDQM